MANIPMTQIEDKKPSPHRTVFLFSLPAIIGGIAWSLTWLHSAFCDFASTQRVAFPYRVSYAETVQIVLSITVILMIWAGPITSTIALILAYRRKLPGWPGFTIKIFNTAWLALSLYLLIFALMVWLGYLSL